jgi:beta-glucanase (GH16 family)
MVVGTAAEKSYPETAGSVILLTLQKSYAIQRRKHHLHPMCCSIDRRTSSDYSEFGPIPRRNDQKVIAASFARHKGLAMINQPIGKTCGIICLLLFLITPMIGQTPAPAAMSQPTLPGWTLAWSDEFNTPGKPDPKKWTYETGFVRNNEPQLYTDRSENVRVEDGCLVIEARKERFANPRQNDKSNGRNKQAFADYTSACITTFGLESWTYGRIEVRAKIPNGKGAWPAIWTLGTKKDEKERPPRWPLNGENDIMELWGARDPHIVQSHLICSSHGKYNSEGKSFKIDDPANTFHVYACETYPDRVDYLVDDQLFESIKTDTPGRVDGDAFHRPQYLLLNVALEPNETDIDPAIFPTKMLVDYVRIYQKN